MAKSPRDRYRTAGELYRAADAGDRGRTPRLPRARGRKRSCWYMGGRVLIAALAAVAALVVVLATSGRLRSDAAADHAGVDRRRDARSARTTTTRRCSASAGAKRSSRGRTTRHSATSTAQVAIYFASRTGHGGRDHDVEQGLPDCGRHRPLLVDRGSEERLRQRAPAVAAQHDRREGVRLHRRAPHLRRERQAAAPLDARHGSSGSTPGSRSASRRTSCCNEPSCDQL